MDWLLHHQLHAIVLLVPVVCLFCIGSWLIGKLLHIRLDQLFDGALSPAATLAFGGGVLGLAIALSGLFFGEHLPLTLLATVRCLLEGLFVLPLMYLGVVVNDKIVLRSIPIQVELHRDRNIGVGLAIAGSAIASGLMINGALEGLSANWWLGFVDLVFYWVLGQLLLVGGITFFDAIRPYSFRSILEEDHNESIGILVCSLLISLGLIARGSIAYTGHFGWLPETLITLSLMALSVTLMIGGRWLIGRLARRTREGLIEIELSNQVSAALILGLLQVGLTWLISTAVQRPLF